MEFMEADNNSTKSKTINNKPIPKSHPQAFYTSHLLSFTKNLNEILEQEENEELLLQSESECLDCIVTDLKSLGMYKKLFYYKYNHKLIFKINEIFLYLLFYICTFF